MNKSNVLKAIFSIAAISISISSAGQSNLKIGKARPRAECERVGEDRFTQLMIERSKPLAKIRAEISVEKDQEKLKTLKEKEKKELDKIAERARDDAIEVCSENPE